MRKFGLVGLEERQRLGCPISKAVAALHQEANCRIRSAIARLEVRLGDSIPNRLTSPRIP
jgi:hypothetical protein